MDHHDKTVKLRRLQQSIRARKGIIGCGSEFSTAISHNGRVLYTGADRFGQGDACDWSGVMALAARSDAIVGLMEDGTLRTAGRRTADLAFAATVSGVRRVEMGRAHLAVLLGNGRVLVGGNTENGCGRTEDWPPVTDIACGRNYTVGLTVDGRVLVAGGSHALRQAVRGWERVAGLFSDFAGEELYAITEEGRLLSTRPLSMRINNQRSLVFVAANREHLWAITAAGHILSTHPAARHLQGNKRYVACTVSEDHTLILTRDGELIAIGSNEYDRCGTGAFGKIFPDFSVFVSDRRAWEARLESSERAYQVAMADAVRYGRRIAAGERLTACLTAEGRVLCTGSLHGWRQWTAMRALACGHAHVLAVLSDGRVVADGNNVDGCCDVEDWTHVRAVAAARYHSMAVLEDGNVRFTGRNNCGQGDITDWQNIRFLRAARDYTVGVTYSGEIWVAGKPPFDLSLIDDRWHGPCDVVATDTHLVALYANGRVRTTQKAKDGSGKDETAGWRRVRAIAAGRDLTIGLCYGGTVLAVGEDIADLQAVANWHHVVAIACGRGFAAALTADGRVRTVGVQMTSIPGRDGIATLTGYKTPDTSRWEDVVAICAGPEHLLGMTREGQILSVGFDGDVQCSGTSHFSLLRTVSSV